LSRTPASRSSFSKADRFSALPLFFSVSIPARDAGVGANTDRGHFFQLSGEGQVIIG
jgi:hypothetical protein